MYNIKLIPYLALYKYMFTLLHRILLWKLYDFGPSNIQLFLIFPMKSDYLSKIIKFQLAFGLFWNTYEYIFITNSNTKGQTKKWKL